MSAPKYSVTVSFDTAAEAAAFLEARVGQAAGAAEDAPAPAPAPAAKPAPRQRKAAEETAAPAAAPAAPAAPATDDVKKQVIAKLVTLINANDALGRNGKQVCTDLCNTFGGKNISAIDPSKYPAVIKAVDVALASLDSDPAA